MALDKDFFEDSQENLDMDDEDFDWNDEEKGEDPFEIERERKRQAMRNERKSGSRKKRSRRGQQKKNVMIFGMLITLVLAVILVVTFIVNRYSPTNDRMSVYSYFGIEHGNDKVMVILDGEQMNDVGIKIEERVYLPYDFVTENINVRFYYDKESDAVLYSTTDTIYSFKDDSIEYTNTEGEKFSTEVPLVKKIEDKIYLDFEFVASKTNCNYDYGKEPGRVVISTKHEEVTCVTARKKLHVRYRAGNKSEILEDIEEGTKMLYLREIDSKWSEVKTPTGITGYVKTSAISKPFIEIPEETFTENYNNITSDEKISMGWFQVTTSAANAYADDYMSKAYGTINTVSPTWYSISDSTGGVKCFASRDFVDKMHQKGIKVWALVDDFNSEVNFAALFASRSSRTRLIETLISDAGFYGYDGINLDFEYVKDAYSRDFLQFVRELSIACEKKGLVLSTDNYKPEAFNSFYDLKEQSAFVDYVIIMGYDEHYAGSKEAGSVASLTFVEEGIKDALKMVPESQLINAVPFFTRIWRVKGSDVSSTAVSMQAALNAIKGKTTGIWNDELGQYIAEYNNGSETVKVWLEEEKSIEEKMKVIKKYNLAGVSAWKLGMEKDGIWSVVEQYNN